MSAGSSPMKTRPSGEQQTTDGAKIKGLSAMTSAFQSGGQLGGFGAVGAANLASGVAGFGAGKGGGGFDAGLARFETGLAGFVPAATAFVPGMGGFVSAEAAQTQEASKAAPRRIFTKWAGFSKNFVV